MLPLTTGYFAGYQPMQVMFGLFAAAALTGAILVKDRNLKGLLGEALAVSLILMLGTYLAHNTIVNLANRKIATGFDFLPLL